MNKPAAIEWMTYSYHDLNGSFLLYNAEHYTDTISYVVHQSIEKMLKAILACNNQPIKKTHNLIELYDMVATDNFILDDEDIALLALATKYHSKQRYPNPHKILPPREEIKQVINFANTLFERVCTLLEISIEEIKV